MSSELDAAQRIAAAVAATAVPAGQPNLVARALAQLDDDERAAWVEVLASDRSAEHVHRAMRHAGLHVGKTDSGVKTWRRNQLLE